ncbi:MAG: uracil-DNA glycosylase [Anaerolineales bacterium]|jgi:uracil-DNA glycosylase family 4|nr:uracil-DNA glycosylase [Anaerolineales bacterium]
MIAGGSNDSQSSLWRELEQDIIACHHCPRLVEWREGIAAQKRRAFSGWEYWGKPVPGFGDHEARLLIVGLAPGAHGSNRTGRMFTGDSSGDTLFSAMHRAGFANKPISRQNGDDLKLPDAFITAVGRCAPPKNRPTAEELTNCQPYLLREIELLHRVRVVLALGQIAFDGYLRALRGQGLEIPRLKFTHGLWHDFALPAASLVACYHPSRQNTQTGRLTQEMLDAVFSRIRNTLDIGTTGT